MQLLEPFPFGEERGCWRLNLQHSHPQISNTLSKSSRLLSQAKMASSLGTMLVPIVKINTLPYCAKRCDTTWTCHLLNTFYVLGNMLSPPRAEIYLILTTIYYGGETEAGSSYTGQGHPDLSDWKSYSFNKFLCLPNSASINYLQSTMRGTKIKRQDPSIKWLTV